jgi:dCTP diphosphatase
MSKNDQEITLQELKDQMIQFRTERGWDKHLTPKNLAISISLEAAELLEHYQWDELKRDDAQEIADELADIIITCISFATVLDLDIGTIFQSKLERIKQKYPTDIFKPGEDISEAYFKAKKAYRSNQKG